MGGNAGGELLDEIPPERGGEHVLHLLGGAGGEVFLGEVEREVAREVEQVVGEFFAIECTDMIADIPVSFVAAHGLPLLICFEIF